MKSGELPQELSLYLIEIFRKQQLIYNDVFVTITEESKEVIERASSFINNAKKIIWNSNK